MLTKQEFIEKANKIHNNKYDYTLVNFQKLKDKIIINCPIHGPFRQAVRMHLKGQACRKCRYGKITLTKEQFIEKANRIHNNKYDYKLINYKNASTKIIINCPIHGLFKQKPNAHIYAKKGCKKCGHEKTNKLLTLTKEQFIEKANKIHNNKYDYTFVNYIGCFIKIKIKCPKHGLYEQTPHNHLCGKGCPKCSHLTSKAQKEIYETIKQYESNIELNNKTIIRPYELDIYLPNQKLAIEYNGIYYHSSKFLNKHNHYKKFINCKNNNIKLIQIFENEWKTKKEIIKAIIKNELQIIPNYIIKKLNEQEFNNYCKNNNIKKPIKSDIMLGAIFNYKIYFIIGFNNFNKVLKCTRYCGSNINLLKLFEYINKNYNPKSINIKSDNRFPVDLSKYRFKLTKIINPQKYYIKHNYVVYDAGYSEYEQFGPS
jgi:hypothetical protein